MRLLLERIKAKIANLNFRNALYSVKNFITAFKKTPDFKSGDELNADVSSSFGRGNHRLKSVEDVIFSLTRIKLPRKLIITSALVIIIVIGLAFVIARARKNLSNLSSNRQVLISDPKATETLNKEFDFPLKDSTGKEVSKFKYIIESVDLRDEIVVKGQKATAIRGKTFLIINFKIVNDHNQGVQINTKDYVRLSVNGNKNEWLAPEIHNDPVEIQAISTKLTRVGFTVNNSDHDLLLRVGEINGEKTELPIKFN